MTELVVSFTVDGLHCWPDAPDRYKEFRQPHRHLFKVVAFYPQGDSDDPARREKELFELRMETKYVLTSINGYPDEEPIDFGSMSCEGLASYLKERVGFSKVFVGEDEWLGAIVS